MDSAALCLRIPGRQAGKLVAEDLIPFLPFALCAMPYALCASPLRTPQLAIRIKYQQAGVRQSSGFSFHFRNLFFDAADDLHRRFLAEQRLELGTVIADGVDSQNAQIVNLPLSAAIGHPQLDRNFHVVPEDFNINQGTGVVDYLLTKIDHPFSIILLLKSAQVKFTEKLTEYPYEFVFLLRAECSPIAAQHPAGKFPEVEDLLHNSPKLLPLSFFAFRTPEPGIIQNADRLFDALLQSIHGLLSE